MKLLRGGSSSCPWSGVLLNPVDMIGRGIRVPGEWGRGWGCLTPERRAGTRTGVCSESLSPRDEFRADAPYQLGWVLLLLNRRWVRREGTLMEIMGM